MELEDLPTHVLEKDRYTDNKCEVEEKPTSILIYDSLNLMNTKPFCTCLPSSIYTAHIKHIHLFNDANYV